MDCNGLKKGSFHLFLRCKWSRVIFRKTYLSPIFDAFLVPKQPNYKAFCDFGGAKMASNGFKMDSFHLFRHSKWSVSWGTNEYLVGD